jgi:REP element-mobilizing transposase RayT
VLNRVDKVFSKIRATARAIERLRDVTRAKKKSDQGAFEFPNGWGGRRRGAGAKPKGERAGVSHARRESFASRFPVHVTLKLKSGLPSLRRGSPHSVLIAAFAAMREREDFRLVHYSIQSNHLHLLCEARDRGQLARGIQALATRIAKRLNALWKRAGKLFADRYHDHVLHTPREARNALGYVLDNARRHGVELAFDRPDPYSSGRWFDAWRRQSLELGAPPSPLSRAKTWLLSVGWSRGGSIECATGAIAGFT